MVNIEANINGSIFDVDDDEVTGMEFLKVSKDLRLSKRIVDMPGKGSRAWLTRDATAAIPECCMPDWIANRPFGASIAFPEVSPTPSTGALTLSEGI
jgi:hypothetical protein